MEESREGKKRRKEEEEEGGTYGIASSEERRMAEGNGGHGFSVSEKDACSEEEDYITAFSAEVIRDERSAAECSKEGRALAEDSSPAAAELFFAWLISPLELQRFHGQFFEKRPFVVHRPANRRFYQGWFGKGDVELLLERNKQGLKYGLHMDVTRFENGARSNFCPAGDVEASVVWSKFSEGWSLRLLHPQRWNDAVFRMLSAFERYWNCVAGCNVYLTPPGAQGFSPHFDDIDAFIIQTEGRKRWKCYRPQSVEEVLPRFPSTDYEQEPEDMVLDVVLEPGDLLYMPRGTIHQAVATVEAHSLHLTVSVGQLNTWADFLELALPRALELAAEEHMLLRGSLPRDFYDTMGVAHCEKSNPARSAFLERVKDCLDCMALSGPWDAAADQSAVRFLKSRLPLPSFLRDKVTSTKTADLKFTSKVQVVAPNVARLIIEDDSAIVYHSLSNSREMHNEGQVEEETGSGGTLEFPVDYAEALELLLSAYPSAIPVSSISLDSKKDCVKLAKQLHEAGLLFIVG